MEHGFFSCHNFQANLYFADVCGLSFVCFCEKKTEKHSWSCTSFTTLLNTIYKLLIFAVVDDIILYIIYSLTFKSIHD